MPVERATEAVVEVRDRRLDLDGGELDRCEAEAAVCRSEQLALDDAGVDAERVRPLWRGRSSEG